jgi:acyl carrier protein
MSAFARVVVGKDEPTWDSLNYLKLVSGFEGAFNVRIALSRIERIRTLREFSRFL